jgi:hypothetical protein
VSASPGGPAGGGRMFLLERVRVLYLIEQLFA